jgi:hypothetical protein
VRTNGIPLRPPNMTDSSNMDKTPGRLSRGVLSIGAKTAKIVSVLAVIGGAAGRAKHKPKTVAGCAGERTHDRPSEIPLALLGVRDGPMCHPCLLADPRLCQPGRLARRSQVLPELPEPLLRVGIVSRAEYQPEVASDHAGEGIHDRPSEISLAPLGKRDSLLRYPCLFADPCLCQPGRLARRAYVRAELPENPVRIRISGYPPPRHFAPIFRFQNLGDI